jgi:ribonuclease III
MTGERSQIERWQKLSELTGHVFVDAARLDKALTHASVQTKTAVKANTNYERLEFLGDRVLGLIIAELLMELYPTASEGELSVRLNALVNAETCAELCDEIGITPFIVTGPEIAQASTSRLVNLRGDVMEAIIAAVFLDGGIDAARNLIRRFWTSRAKIGAAIRRDPKTELQEWAHKAHGVSPVYEIISRDGPDHEPVFVVALKVGTLTARASGASKRDGERAAATQILIEQGIWAKP